MAAYLAKVTTDPVQALDRILQEASRDIDTPIILPLNQANSIRSGTALHETKPAQDIATMRKLSPPILLCKVSKMPGCL